MALFAMLQSGFSELLEYLSAHVLTCLVPAFLLPVAFRLYFLQEQS